MKDCFALRGSQCSILRIKLCEENVCGFYKTREQFQLGQEKAWQRIISLDESRRKHINETYYGGRMGEVRDDS